MRESHVEEQRSDQDVVAQAESETMLKPRRTDLVVLAAHRNPYLGEFARKLD